MATKDKSSAAKKTPGKQVLEFKILNAETRERVIKCIKENGKISVVLNHTGTLPGQIHAGFEQQID